MPKPENLFKGKLPNYYKVLGVMRNATPEEIRTAYLTIAKKQHPDAGGDAGLLTVASEAYHVLRDERKRNAYNQRLVHLVPPCLTCRGLGYLRRQKGLTTVVNYKCTACDGTGLKPWETK